MAALVWLDAGDSAPSRPAQCRSCQIVSDLERSGVIGKSDACWHKEMAPRPLVWRSMPGRQQTLLPQPQERAALDASTVNAARVAAAAAACCSAVCPAASANVLPRAIRNSATLYTSALSGRACSACQSYDLLQRQSTCSSWRNRTIETQRRGCEKLSLCSTLLPLQQLRRLLQSSCPVRKTHQGAFSDSQWS